MPFDTATYTDEGSRVELIRLSAVFTALSTLSQFESFL